MIIGICGLIGSGKGTVADILVKEHGFTKISFADALKDGVSAMFGWSREMLEGDTDESRKWREVEDPFWTKELGKPISPRLVLQIVGTECMRDGFDDRIWLNIVKKKITQNPGTNFVIPDTRFMNEADMLHSIGGQVWRVKRGDDPKWLDDYINYNIVPEHVHSSEWEWAKCKFDQVIYNNHNKRDLWHQVRNLV